MALVLYTGREPSEYVYGGISSKNIEKDYHNVLRGMKSLILSKYGDVPPDIKHKPGHDFYTFGDYVMYEPLSVVHHKDSVLLSDFAKRLSNSDIRHFWLNKNDYGHTVLGAAKLHGKVDFDNIVNALKKHDVPHAIVLHHNEPGSENSKHTLITLHRALPIYEHHDVYGDLFEVPKRQRVKTKDMFRNMVIEAKNRTLSALSDVAKEGVKVGEPKFAVVKSV